MAQQSGGNVPQIRFQGFEGEWADKPIGEVLAEKKRPIVLKDRQRYELITVKRRNEGVVSRGHLFGRDILVKNYSQLHAGDFVVSKRQVVHGATGIIPKKLNGAIVSNEYLVAVNSSSLLTEFLTILASLPDMRRKFFLSSYGVDIEKLFFDAEDWKKRNVTIPGITEQTQIGEYFRELDSLIGLHQRKHDKLVTLKKAMLQKMFPQTGATNPEIRLKGIEGDWKTCRLDEVATLERGKFSARPRNDPKYFVGGNIPFVQTGDVVSANRLLRRYSQTLNEGGLAVSRSFPANTILITIAANIGDLAITDFGVACPDSVVAINSREDFDTNFLYDFLGTKKDYLEAAATTAAQANINLKILKPLIIVAPALDEQTQIGKYFRTLDALISKHATQLQKLQQIKSACLEKMFV